MRYIDDLIKTLYTEISGERALDTVTAVARYNRIVGSTDYAAVVHWLQQQLTALGLDTVTVESYPIDGQRKYTGRVLGPAWEPHSARLEVIAPERSVVADFAVTPMCLPSGCPATAPAGVTAAVIDVGRGDRAADYAGLEVAGKAVLATGLTTDVYNLAVEQYGAACVMTTNMYDWSALPEIQRTMVDLPDATHLARLYHDASKRRPSPVFSITYRHAERLRALARQGVVQVHATVEAETKPGELLVVTATIAGADLSDEEVWITAHLCHPKPGACDNASGVALGVELMRALARLLRSGRLARPRRTVRLLLLPEMSGTQAYLDRHQEQMDKVVAVLNLDMVGASYAKTGAYCRLVQTPWSRPSFLNHLGAYVLEQVSLGSHSHIVRTRVRNWLYALNPYDKGSDHDVTLNSSYTIPSLFFFYWPHRYYHTDYDTPEKLDPLEFKRTGAVVATLVMAAAAPHAELAAALLDLIRIEATREITATSHGLHSPNGDVPTELATDRLWALGEREQGALRSVLQALPPAEQPQVQTAVARSAAAVAQLLAALAGDQATNPTPAAQQTPRRIEPWPLNLGQIERADAENAQRLQALRSAISDFEDKAIAALNYVDGVRSVAQIARLVRGELGAFSTAHAEDLCALLARSGVITFV